MANKLSKETKLTLQFWLGVVVILAGLTMLFMGIWIPPTGAIDSSILVAFGESATFAGALIGVDYRYKFQTYKLDKQDELRKLKEEREDE